ncbi:MAG: hypothetical protein CFE37_07240 [Alphaproteobacteria bacterium PA4]|nr:MAG: hypothetical protein CFE37_07240 [Alphaproteobacteria bacterium PA4]
MDDNVEQLPPDRPVVIEAPEPPHQHQHSGNPWFDRILAISVVAASFASLYVSLHTGRTMEALVDQNARLVRANSTPLLVMSHGNLDDAGKPEISYELSNAGTGPARIVWLELYYKGKASRYLRDYLQPMGAPANYNLTFTSSVIANTMLSGGEKVRFIRYKKPAGQAELAAWQVLDKGRWQMTATACYCSLLNECWTSHLGADVPTPVKACSATGRNSINDPTPIVSPPAGTAP